MEDLLELFRPDNDSADFLITSNAQRKTIDGEEYVLADAVILREGVLNGSEGPLFYSEAEITKRVGMWNGVTVSAPHPYVWDSGKMKFVSINASPDINLRFAVGTLFNDRVEKGPDGKAVRKVTIHYNVDRANKVDGRIIPAVLSGQPINLSTGIYTDKKKAVDNSEYGGRKYTHTVHNITPDHLATLMDERGACSVSDGCGINVNASQISSWTKEDVATVVAYNRDWPKDKRATLAKSSPEDFAGPHQSFPIQTQADVDSAAKLIGHADDPAAVKAKIIAIAKRKGLKIPASWEKDATHNSDVETPVTNTIRKLPNGQYRLYSGEGKNLGTFDSLEAAKKHEHEVEYFKHIDNLDHPVVNAWTNAARAASLAARRKSASAAGKDKKNKSSNKIRRVADSAVSHHGVGDFKRAHTAHRTALKMHTKAMRTATKAGRHAVASAHSDAAAAHRAAMHVYSRKSTRNSSGSSATNSSTTYPEVCPKCGGPMDPGVGKCTACGYESEPISNGEGQMNKKGELVSWLVANCDCWKEQGSDTVLNNLSEKQLETLKTNALKAGFADVSTQIVRKIGQQVGFDPKKQNGGYNNLPDFVANAMKDPDDKYEDDDEEEEVNNSNKDDFSDFAAAGGGKKKKSDKQSGRGDSVMNNSSVEETVKNVFKGMTVEQWKEWAPEPVREVFNTAEKVQTERKVAIINSLTSGIQDPEHRKAEILNLRKKKLPELEEIAKYAGVKGGNNLNPLNNANETDDERFLRTFFGLGKGPAGTGNGGGSVNNNGNTQQDEGVMRAGNFTLNTKDVLVPHVSIEDYE